MSVADNRSTGYRGTGQSTRRRAVAEVKSQTNALILLIYTVSILWPIKFQIGPLYLTVSRIMIILLLVPMFARLFSGRFGGIKSPDITVMLFCLWAFIALSVNHGAGAVFEKSIMFFVETCGAYLIGRIFIRTREDLVLFIKYLVIGAMISIPFVIVEMRTGQPVVLEVLRKINPMPGVLVLPNDIQYETRMGMHRAQFTLSHPIFYGVFCAALMGLAITVLTQGRKMGVKVFWGSVVGIATFASLSSGAFLSVLVQWLILIFERVTRSIKARWKLLSAATIVIYIFLDIAATNSPIAVFVTIFSFNPATAYNRLQIFEYGSAEVLRHPIFGIGNHEWTRPVFMPLSVDNHWLLDFMRYGFPGGLLLVWTVMATVITVGRAPTDHDQNLKIAQRGYMASMIGFIMAMATVSIGVELFSFFMTLLAAGHWITDTARETAPEGARASRGRLRAAGPESREPRRATAAAAAPDVSEPMPKRNRPSRKRPAVSRSRPTQRR